MFRFGKSRDIITLFHKANSPVSTRVAALLKQTSAAVSEASASDQSSKAQRDEFDLNVTEDPPTTGQLETILDYAGNLAIPTIVKGAESREEAMKRFKLNPESFQRPVVVDWHNGKAVGGGNESAILTMLNALPDKS